MKIVEKSGVILLSTNTQGEKICLVPIQYNHTLAGQHKSLQDKQTIDINQQLLSFPGGGIDQGENPWQAAARELVEESGGYFYFPGIPHPDTQLNTQLKQKTCSLADLQPVGQPVDIVMESSKDLEKYGQAVIRRYHFFILCVPDVNAVSLTTNCQAMLSLHKDVPRSWCETLGYAELSWTELITKAQQLQQQTVPPAWFMIDQDDFCQFITFQHHSCLISFNKGWMYAFAQIVNFLPI